MHYTMYELDQYRDGTMFWFRRLRCRFHLGHCLRCRERLLRLDQDEMLIGELKRSTRDLSVPDDPKEYDALCGLFHENPGRRHSTI